LDGQRSQELLEENAPPIAPGRAAVALRHIAAFDPQRALDLYQDGMEGNAELQLALLQGLRGGCPDDAKEVLGKLAHVTYDLNQGKSMWVDPEPRRAAWWGALIRAGCSLPSEGFIKLYDNEVYRDNDRDFNVMAYMLHNHDPAVLDWIKRDIEQLAPTELAGHKSANWLTDFEREIRLWSDMRILAATRTSFDQALILRLTAFDLDKDIKIGAGRLLLSDPSFDRSLLLRGSAGDAWILALLVDDGWFDEALVRDTVRSTIRRSTPNLGSNFSDSLKYLTKMIRRRHVAAAAEVVKEIGETAPDPDVRVEASLTLDAISPKQVRQAKRSRRSDFFDRLDSGNLFALPKPATSASLGDSYRYYVSRYDQGFDDFMKSFGKSAWDDARFLGRTPLSASGLAELRALLSKPTTKLSSAAVLAMAANEEDLLGILSSPDIELRQEALKYAAYNSALPNLVSSQTLAATGRQTQFYLTRQIKLKGFIEEALRDERLISKGLVLKILLAGSVNVSPGLELWAADVLDSLDGQVEDGAGELVLFDAH
jgi:hypothetical protein